MGEHRLRGRPDRREILASIAAGAAAAPLCAATSVPPFNRPRPGAPGWPDPDAWAELGRAVGDRLSPVSLPDLEPPQARVLLKNPLYIRDHAALTQSSGSGAGPYLSECSYHLADWREACWGVNWTRLARAKARYDPDDLFVVRHGVGGERWSADGFTRL